VCVCDCLVSVCVSVYVRLELRPIFFAVAYTVENMSCVVCKEPWKMVTGSSSAQQNAFHSNQP